MGFEDIGVWIIYDHRNLAFGRHSDPPHLEEAAYWRYRQVHATLKLKLDQNCYVEHSDCGERKLPVHIGSLRVFMRKRCRPELEIWQNSITIRRQATFPIKKQLDFSWMFHRSTRLPCVTLTKASRTHAHDEQLTLWCVNEEQADQVLEAVQAARLYLDWKMPESSEC